MNEFDSNISATLKEYRKGGRSGYNALELRTCKLEDKLATHEEHTNCSFAEVEKNVQRIEKEMETCVKEEDIKRIEESIKMNLDKNIKAEPDNNTREIKKVKEKVVKLLPIL